MGLDTTHNCWHGPYSSFNDFRRNIMLYLGNPPLDEMEGFGGTHPWSEIKDKSLNILLNHSDCDGKIDKEDCLSLALAIDDAMPLFEDDYTKERAAQFAGGLFEAHCLGEDVEFH